MCSGLFASSFLVSGSQLRQKVRALSLLQGCMRSNDGHAEIRAFREA